MGSPDLCRFPTLEKSPSLPPSPLLVPPLGIPLPRSDTGFSTGLPALVAQVFPSVSFPFLASGSLHIVPHFSATQVHSLSPTRVYLFNSSLALPFLASGSSDFVAVAFPSTDVPALPRSPFESRFYHPGFGVRFCGPRVAPKRPHTTPPERQIGERRVGKECRSRWSPYH